MNLYLQLFNLSFESEVEMECIICSIKEMSAFFTHKI